MNRATGVGVQRNEGDPELCKAPLACASLVPEPPRAVPENSEPLDLERCTRAAASLCSSGAVSGGGQCPEPANELSLTVSAAQDGAVLRELSCRAVRLSHSANDKSSALQLDLDAWTDVRMDVESVEPFTLELSGGKLKPVSYTHLTLPTKRIV